MVTYIYEPLFNKKETIYVFRFPGATMGHIKVDKNMIIKDIVFYEDSCYQTKYSGKNNKGKSITWVGMYDRQVEYIIPKYIGMKLVINEESLHN